MIDIRHRVRTTAFHEAGHAFAALHFGIPFQKVWIMKRTDYEIHEGKILGQLTRVPPVNKPDYFGKLDAGKAEATLAFCGPIAECMADPEKLPHPDLQGTNYGDWFDARSCLRFTTTPCTPTNQNPFRDEDLAKTAQHVAQLLEECQRAAEALVNGNQAAITRLAEALLTRWDIPADEVKQIIEGDRHQQPA